MPKQAELRKIERDDRRASKWGISIPQTGKRPRRVFFKTARARDFEFNKLKRLTRDEGHGVLSDVTAADVALLKDIRSILPADIDPREACRFYVAHRCPDSTVSLNEAMRGFLKKQQLAHISQEHYNHIELHLNRLVDGAGRETPVSGVGQDMISDLLLGLPFQPTTVDGHQKNWGTFFNWCVKQQYCAMSPLAGMDRIDIPETEPEFMPVPDVKAFFKAALEIHPDYAPVLALSFFAGMRSSAIRRLERADIDFEQRGIRHRGAQHKTKRRFFVQDFEDNLWAWLEPWRKLTELPNWPSSTAIKWRENIYKKAKVVFPHNAGRHSFCTYHVALFGSADRTANLLTHRGSVSTLYDHYRGNATKAKAERYFKIVP
ncbi:hypothetical protein PDESU_03721 [Pontiella desulfatans]|uniref:Tyr recombinase domain-containing protein n=1 Tax=Pontiella desulfatans TaxID=2750659 RepID=A0A6C2U574_PONDE|nr:site-specific integrase [Pontiella desulfatans]VGO15140.1 hypothetical protein PDESU_03721 [Pontiella desulfatans]